MRKIDTHIRSILRILNGIQRQFLSALIEINKATMEVKKIPRCEDVAPRVVRGNEMRSSRTPASAPRVATDRTRRSSRGARRN
jgi:hypothetical protein